MSPSDPVSDSGQSEPDASTLSAGPLLTLEREHNASQNEGPVADMVVERQDDAIEEKGPEGGAIGDGSETICGLAGLPVRSTSLGKGLDAREEEVLADRTQDLALFPGSEEPSTPVLKATQPADRSSTPPPPPPKDDKYLDPTPKTPLPSGPPSRSPSDAASTPHSDEDVDEMGAFVSNTKSTASSPDKLDGLHGRSTRDVGRLGSRTEIQNIMDQFEDHDENGGAEQAASDGFELSPALLASPLPHPPRRSSLEPIRAQQGSSSPTSARPHDVQTVSSPAPMSPTSLRSPLSPSLPQRPGFPRALSSTSMSTELKSPTQTPTLSTLSQTAQSPPFPEPDPEPDLPFDFHRFLEQLRHRTADPVAGFLRSFLTRFGEKQWMVHQQVKFINDFLIFITERMAQCEVWANVSDAEFDNAREGMEKLVMNRLYSQTFSPAIPPPAPLPTAKGKRIQSDRLPGRRGQHQEDVERDDVLAQKVRIYGWVREEHLDIKPVGDSGRRFLTLAQQELLKIKTYRAPRDKVICVLNCCKVIFGLLRNSKSDQSADSFVPLLIYVVLQANPEHLVSNVQYIMRFRNQEKLGGEAGYYLSSLMGAIQFIESLDRTSLTISDEEFEQNVEAAVSSIAEKHAEDKPLPPTQIHVAEKSTISRPEVTSRNSMEAEYSSPRKSTSSREGGDPSSDGDEKAAVTGLLRTIQRPLSTIGRIFSEDGPHANQGQPGAASRRAGHPHSTPQPGTAKRASPKPADEEATARPRSAGPSGGPRNRLSAEDAAARQASAETAEAQRIQSAEHANVVETLSGIFPDLDKEIIDDVVRMKQGRVGLAVEACLALNT